MKTQRRYRCRLCPPGSDNLFDDRHDLKSHQNRVHKLNQIGYGPPKQGRPFLPGQEPWTQAPYTLEFMQGMEDCYSENEPIILAGHDGDSVRFDYNVPLKSGFNTDEIMAQIQQIAETTDVCFKLLFSVGKIMYHTTKKRFRYWIPFDNCPLFDKSLFVTCAADLVKVRNKLNTVNPADYLASNRPDTKHICVLATNVVITVFETFYPMGRPKSELPQHILNCKSLVRMLGYNDHACFFRCMSMHKFQNVRENYTRYLYKMWMDYCIEHDILKEMIPMKEFEGITLQDLPVLEKVYKTNIQVYCLNPEGSVNMLFRSADLYKKTLHLNECDGHLSYISNFTKYAKKFVCKDCEYITSRSDRFKDHLKNCSTVRKVKVHGGYFQNPLSLFEKLDELGVHVSEELRYVDRFAVYDFESLLLSKQEEVSSSTQITQVHKPFSFSIISNIEGFTEPKFVVDRNEEKLIDSFHDILCSMQEKYSSDRREIYAPYLEMIQEKIDYWKPPKITKVKNHQQEDEEEEEEEELGSECGETDYCEPPSAQFLEAMKRKNPWNNFISNLVENDTWNVQYNDNNANHNGGGGGGQVSESENSGDSTEQRLGEASEDVDSNQSLPFNNVDEGFEDEVIEDIEQLRVPRNLVKYQKIMYKKYVNLYEELINFINRLTLIGFNSGKYDLKLIQGLLFIKFDPLTLKVIKKNNRLLSVTTPQFRFLDMVSFLSPGSNYSSFVRGFASDSSNIDENKMYFPYPCLRSYDCLLQPSLPPIDHPDWYSKLKGCNILHDPESGRTKEENYRLMQKVWDDKGCTNLLSFLAHYNNNDTIPFLSAVSTILKRYRDLGLCLFSRCVSGPAVSRILMYQCARKAGCYFALPGKANTSLQKVLLSGIIGGNSVIYRRFVKCGETYVWGHDSGEITKGIKGFDCTSLYGGLLGSYLPTGSFLRRFKHNDYKITVRHDMYTLQYQYIEWLSKKLNREPLHRQSRGHEVYIGALKPDAILLPANKNQKSLVVEVLGCWAHYHICNKTYHCRKNKVWMENARKNTHEWELKESYYEQLGYECHFIRECDLDELFDTDEEYRNLVKLKRPNFARLHPGTLTESQIIQGILDDQLFAMIVCDINLPEEWTPELKAKLHCPPHLTPREFWDVCPPVFGNCTLKYPEHWSPVMQEYAKEHSINTSDRTLLVAGCQAEQLPITTGYAKFLLTHGFEISNISEICEYTPKRAFQSFVDTRTEWRREADRNPKMKILATQGKAENNFGYGVTLTNSAKWTNVKYVKGVREASKEVNDKLFIKLETINASKDLFEIEKEKKIVEYRYPSQIGFWILWESKTYLLKFYFDFILKFINFSSVSPILGDTDSIYLNLGQYTFEGCVKEEMRSFFHYLTKGRCVKVTGIQYIEPDGENTFFPRSCCDFCKKNDSRTPLLFHLEAEGHQSVALCSKTYAILNKKESEENVIPDELVMVKYSCKGQTRCNVKKDGSQYLQAYNDRTNIYAENVGFQHKKQKGQDSKMVTYVTQKSSFQWLYLKRYILGCGCCSRALNITIRPKKIKL